MFPAFTVTLEDDIICQLPSLCYPHGNKKISLLGSDIITGFAFYTGQNKYIVVALHIYISLFAKSFVGNQFDRSYPFCICLVSDNPDIASHFSFLCDIVDLIFGKKILPKENVIIPNDLLNYDEKCIRFLHVKPNCSCIAVSYSINSMNFLLPKLINYYQSSAVLKYGHNDFLLYPTLQTLLTFLSPSKIVEI